MSDQFDNSPPVNSGGSLPDMSDQFGSNTSTQSFDSSYQPSKWAGVNSQYENKYNLQSGFLDALGAHESGNDISATNKTSSAYGQFQMTDAAWKDTGIDPRSKDVRNPAIQADSAGKYFSNILTGPAHNDYELALRMYFQGAGASHEKLYSKEANDYVNDPRFQPFLNKQNQDQGSVLPDMSDQFSTGQEEVSEQPQEAPGATQQGNWSGNAGYLQPTARALTGAAVNVANIPAEMADAVSSAGAWVGGKLGIGDGTYKPAPRVTTSDIEQGLHLQPGSLTPQQTSEKAMADAIPFLFGGGEVEAATGATRAAKVTNALVRNLNASALGSLAQHSDKDDPEGLAADMALNTVVGAGFEGVANVATKAITQPRQALNDLSNAVFKSQRLAKQLTEAKNDLTKADLAYTIGLRKKLPESKINDLRSQFIDAENNLDSIQQQHDQHLIDSGLAYQQGNKVVSKAPYLADKTDFLRELNENGANVGIKDVSEQLKSGTGEASPLLTQYGIKPNLGDNLSHAFDNTTLGKLSEWIGIKAGDQAGRNADAADKVLQKLGSGIAEKVSDPDSVGWQSLIPVIKDLRSKQWESAETAIKDLRTEMTESKAYDELGMTTQEFEQFHKTLDDLNTMRKFLANSPSNRTVKTIHNITGRILAHYGLLHVSGPVAMVGVPAAKKLVSNSITAGKRAGLRNLNSALKGEYKPRARDIIASPFLKTNSAIEKSLLQAGDPDRDNQ